MVCLILINFFIVMAKYSVFDFSEVRFVPPFGSELNLVSDADGNVSVHSDDYVLLHLQEKRLAQNELDSFMSRFRSVSVPDGLSVTDSRFAPWLSDKLDAAKAEFASYKSTLDKDKADKEQKDFDEKLSALRARLFGVSNLGNKKDN